MRRTLANGYPVYDSWDEAMADPALDLGAPWFVVAEPAPQDGPVHFTGWPDSWREIGATRDPEDR
jgi:hypothetical protein